MRKLPLLAFIYVALAAGAPVQAEPMRVHIPVGESAIDSRSEHAVAVLYRALALTERDFGPFEVLPAAAGVTQGRNLESVARSDGALSLIWTMTTLEREQLVSPIRIPVYLGLIGYRVGLIRAEDQNAFAQADSIAELTQHRVCLGRDWPDAPIMEAAGFQVVIGSDYESLFAMLAAGECDFFSRAVYEAYAEFDAREALYPNLAVEASVLIRYPTAAYFFVDPAAGGLRRRLAAGLRAMADGGVLRRMAFRDPGIDEALSRADLERRRVIDIENPLLPSETPAADPSLWFDPAFMASARSKLP